MAKAKKTDTPKPTETVPVTMSSVTVAGASSKKTKAPKATKTAETTASQPIMVKETTPTKNAIVEESVEPTDVLLTKTFGDFLIKLQALATSMNSIKTEFRLLEKKASKELKAAQKITTKRARKSGNRAPSGFVKPTLISDELAKFLSKPSGTEMARTEVTREINGYIRANNLQDKSNGRKINPDNSLASLLKIGSDEELTYFNLQRYMSPHFAKASKIATTV